MLHFQRKAIGQPAGLDTVTPPAPWARLPVFGCVDPGNAWRPALVFACLAPTNTAGDYGLARLFHVLYVNLTQNILSYCIGVTPFSINSFKASRLNGFRSQTQPPSNSRPTPRRATQAAFPKGPQLGSTGVQPGPIWNAAWEVSPFRSYWLILSALLSKWRFTRLGYR